MLRLFNQGTILGPDGEKMSKSRGNVVNPDDYVERYGADTVRGYLMFIGPWELGGPWDPSAIEGVSRFLHRVWAVIVDAPSRPASGDPGEEEVRNLERKLHQTIIKVTDDMQNFRFNTAIAALMEMNNWLVRTKDTAIYDTPAWREAIHNLVLLMAPIFPHISEELWHYLGHTESIHLQAWPQADAEKAREEEIAIVVQVNGKVRDKLVKAPGTAQDVLERRRWSCPTSANGSRASRCAGHRHPTSWSTSSPLVNRGEQTPTKRNNKRRTRSACPPCFSVLVCLP